jgi:hypothetical protein
MGSVQRPANPRFDRGTGGDAEEAGSAQRMTSPPNTLIKPERSIEKKGSDAELFLFRLIVLKTGTPT